MDVAWWLSCLLIVKKLQRHGYDGLEWSGSNQCWVPNNQNRPFFKGFFLAITGVRFSSWFFYFFIFSENYGYIPKSIFQILENVQVSGHIPGLIIDGYLFIILRTVQHVLVATNVGNVGKFPHLKCQPQGFQVIVTWTLKWCPFGGSSTITKLWNEPLARTNLKLKPWKKLKNSCKFQFFLSK
jgi:hypothetical protein